VLQTVYLMAIHVAGGMQYIPILTMDVVEQALALLTPTHMVVHSNTI